MESRAKFLGHPVHQMLIGFPLGLLTASIIFDLTWFFTGNPRWADIGFWMISIGIVSGLIAAVFGFIDYLAIPNGTRAKFIGTLHGVGNVIVVALFASAWALRYDAPHVPGTIALTLSVIAVALLAVTGWLGGELVDRLGVGVDNNAHLDAPNSITNHHAA